MRSLDLPMHRLKANGRLVVLVEHCWLWLVHAVPIFLKTVFSGIWPRLKLWKTCASSRKCSPVLRIAFTYRIKVSVLAQGPSPLLVWLMYCLGEEVVNLALVGSFPVPQAPVVTVGGDIEGKWWVQNTSGLFRSARNPDGKDDYTPLYMLKNIRKKTFFSRRGEKPPEHEGDDLWAFSIHHAESWMNFL